MKSECSSVVSCLSTPESVENHFEFVFDRYQSSDLIILQQRISSNFGDFSDFLLCREILWMFMGFKELHFFLMSNGYLPSTQFPNPLFTLLTRLCLLSNKLLKLRDFCQFVQSVSLQNSSFSKSSKNSLYSIDPHSTITFQAFSSVLRLFLHDIDTELIELEKQLLVHSACIIALFNNLLVLSAKISYFYQLFIECINPPNDQMCSSPFSRVCWLLDSLWREITLCDLQYMVIPKLLPLSISAFLITLTPLFDFISQWFFDGHLYDEYQEFFIHQIEFPMNCDKLSSFWENGCKIRTSEMVSYVPKFLRDLAPKILSAGKSLGCLSFLGVNIANISYRILYFTFIDDLFREIGNCPISLLSNLSPPDLYFRIEFVISTLSTSPFLRGSIINMNNYSKAILSNEGFIYQRGIWEKLQHVQLNFLSTPLVFVIRKVVNGIILPISDISSLNLMNHLISYSSIYLELKMLFNIYLFGDILAMRKFSEILFETKDFFFDSLFVTDSLLKIIYSFHPNLNLDDKLFVTIGHSRNIDDIRLHYTINPLASIVISPSNILKYQDIFTFLLNLKYIEHNIHNTHLFVKRSTHIKKCSIFILNEMNFYFSIISQYFINYVIMVHFYAFISIFESKDIDVNTLVKEHQKFINLIHIKCFLDVSHKEFYLILRKLFELIATFCLGIEDFNSEVSFFVEIKRDLDKIIKHIFTILRIPTSDHRFDFLIQALNYNYFISQNLL